MGKTRDKKIKKNATLKKPVRIASSSIHKSRVKVGESVKCVRMSEKDQKSVSVVRRVILTVIVLAMMSVILAVLVAVFHNPEAIIESKIESIAADYYVNYYYEKILDNVPSDKSIGELMTKYAKGGFSDVSLRQLMLFDSRRHADAEAELYRYCDPDETLVHFYPEEPFDAKGYRVEYKYACIF